MDLEEKIKTRIKLYVVEESSHVEECDIYSYSTLLWHHEKPIYFTSKELANNYREDRTKKLLIDGYVEYKLGSFYSKDSAYWKHNIDVVSCKVKKDKIVQVKNKTYFFNTRDNILHEIYDVPIKTKPEVKT